MQEKSNSNKNALADVEPNKTDAFVAVATTPAQVLPRTARLPINRCNLPADILGGLTFQRHPVQIELDSVAQLHRGLFALLDRIDDAKERARAFILHMNASFYLDEPEQAGLTSHARHKRQKADYLRMVRGYSTDYLSTSLLATLDKLVT